MVWIRHGQIHKAPAINLQKIKTKRIRIDNTAFSYTITTMKTPIQPPPEPEQDLIVGYGPDLSDLFVRQFEISIMRTSDGEVRKLVWGNWTYNRYWWADGNAGCDCNRGDWFHRAANETEEDGPCGHALYTVQLRDVEADEILYTETYRGLPFGKVPN